MTSGDAYDAKDSFKKKFYFWDENGANHIDQKNKLPAITDNYCHLSLGKYNYEKNIWQNLWIPKILFLNYWYNY